MHLHASDKHPEYTEVAPLNEVCGGTGSSRVPKGPGGLTQRMNQGARSGMGGTAELGGVKGRKWGELVGRTGPREKKWTEGPYSRIASNPKGAAKSKIILTLGPSATSGNLRNLRDLSGPFGTKRAKLSGPFGTTRQTFGTFRDLTANSRNLSGPAESLHVLPSQTFGTLRQKNGNLRDPSANKQQPSVTFGNLR